MVGTPQTPENLQGSSLNTKKGAAYKRYKKLEDDRSSWRNHWIEITDYLLPRRGRYLSESQNSKGRKRNTKIIDNTGGHALRTLSAGMMSGLTSPARPWFRLQAVDESLMDAPEVKDWFGEVEKVLRRILSSSNFYNMMSTTYTELGAFGTHATLRRGPPTRILHYRPYTAGEYVVAEDEYGDVDTLGRCYTMTVSQIVERFAIDRQTGKPDWDKVSRAVKRLWDNHNYDELIEVIHIIQPRRQSTLKEGRMDGANRPWADLYFEKGGDKDVFLQESGYARKPFFVSRWDVLGGDVYGRCPGMEHLGDVKQLQHQQRRKAEAIDKLVNPPMVASTSLKGKPTTVIPGGTTYVDQAQGSQGFAPAYLVNPQLRDMKEDIMEVQERIQRGFYADLFAMMINSDRRQMTATEVAERHEEKLVLLGPVLQRLNTELLDPLIEDAFMVAMQRDLLPEMPEVLMGEEIDIKYISLLAQAQEAVAATAIERTYAFAASLAEVTPDILDNLDPDEAIRDYAEIVGTSPNIVREQNVVEAIRQERRERQEQERQAALAAEQAKAMQQSAQGAATLAEADSTNPNALERVLGGGQRV